MAYCSNCGNQLSDAAPACPKCGHPTTLAAPVQQVVGNRTEGSAVASLVCGILGIVACPLILSIPAIIVGNSARSKIAQDPSLEGDSMARAGIILGWVGVGLAVLGIGIAILAITLGVTRGGRMSY